MNDYGLHRDGLEAVLKNVFFCGPLKVFLTSQDLRLRDKVAETLRLYDVVWEDPYLPVRIKLKRTNTEATMVVGDYLNCARMNVDATPNGLYATCVSGVSCSYSVREDNWSISVPERCLERGTPFEVEDVFTLILTHGWRRVGWTPIHSGAVMKTRCCAIVSAPSGAGKTTLVTALMRRGWKSLGDDKLLLRLDQKDNPELAALVHSLNVDPEIRKWFPEMSNLEALSPYSTGTKRRVRIDDFWPAKSAKRCKATHLVQLNLSKDLNTVKVSRMTVVDVLSTLLRQTVIPKDATAATQILSAISTTATQLSGLKVEVGQDAYRDDRCLDPLEAALR